MKITTPPQAPAVDVADLLGEMDFGIADDDQRDALKRHIDAATDVVETACSRPMSPREAEFMAPGGCWQCWWFPVAPVTQLIGIAWTYDWLSWTDVPVEDVALAFEFDTPALVLPQGFRDGAAAQALAVRVRAEIGYPADLVPLKMVQAVKLQAKQYYEAGIAVEYQPRQRLSFGVERLIRQQRYRRPREVA